MQISYIPQDIIYNHIIPYTYQPQPSTLLKDIVHYHNSLDFIIKHYLDVFSNTQSYKTIISYLKVDIRYYLSKNTVLSKEFSTIVWRIYIYEPKTELYMIRRMWGHMSIKRRNFCILYLLYQTTINARLN